MSEIPKELEHFDFSNTYKREINDGFISRIWLEDGNWDPTVGISDDNKEVTLQTTGNAVIEFANGKRILIKNSEWCSLIIF